MFRYTLHNMIGHPVMELCFLLGLKKLGAWVHDSTLPKEWEKDYSNSWDAGEGDDDG